MTGALSHFDASGAAHMVDVSAKPVTDRVAVAVLDEAPVKQLDFESIAAGLLA